MKKHSIVLGAVLLGLLSALSSAQLPLVNQPLVPDATAPGGPQFTLTVNGTGFASNSVVKWNGDALVTQFVSGSRLTATVPAAKIATAATASVTVVNPAPGGGTSNAVVFSITEAVSSVALRQSTYAAGVNPLGAVVADLNADGKADVIVSNHVGGSTISVFMGNGDGTFQARVPYTTGVWPRPAAVADFNRDGILDLAVANYRSFSVSILLGNGDGTFQSQEQYGTSGYPGGAAAADFNGDGIADLVVANLYDGSGGHGQYVDVLLGNGDGTFQSKVSYAAGSGPNYVAIGDFNGDGLLDLAVENYFSSDISILLGKGNGTFRTQVSYPTGGNPYWIDVADLNGDGVLDLVTPNLSDGTVSVLLGVGNGSFLSHVDYPVGQSPYGVSIADVNGDGKLDLVVDNIDTNNVSVLLGNGDGTFEAQTQYAVGGGPGGAVGIGDFNRDGKLDLAVANGSAGTVSILLQVPASPAVLLSPSRLDFGSQLIHTASTPQTVTLTNAGNATLEISSIVASDNFYRTKHCPASLAVGASCKISVTFRPKSVCPKTGTLTITDNAANSPQTVALSGVGTVVTLSTKRLDFGSQAVGTTSSPQTVTFTNHDKNFTVPIYNVQIKGGNFLAFAQTNTCGTSVPPGASCTFSVTFTPHDKGAKTSTLYIWNGGGNTPETVTLTGNSAPRTINVATGLDCSNNLITIGGSNDCHWTVNGNPAQVVEPGNSDWWPGWVSDGPNSDWIAINANTCCDGPAPYSFNLVFDLSGSNLSAVSLSGLWSIDDAGTLSLNGQQIDAQGGLWGSLQPFSVPAGSPYFQQGTNTLTITMTSTDNYLEGVRLEGTITGVPAK